MDECPDQWCEDGGCDQDVCANPNSANHGDYCYLCSEYSGNCEQYCYDMDDCPDNWCLRGGCDWAVCAGY